MTFVVSNDFGPFGANETRVTHEVAAQAGLLQFFPWLVLGALLFAPWNSRRRALAAVGALPVAAHGVFIAAACMASVPSTFTAQLLPPPLAMLFALSALWMLPWESRRLSVFKSLAMLLGVFLLFGGFTLATLNGTDGDIGVVAASWMVFLFGGVGALLALLAAGLRTRRNLTRKRFVWQLVLASALSTLALLALVITLQSAGSPRGVPWGVVLKIVSVIWPVLTLLYVVLLVPFAWMTFRSAFLRARLHAALRAPRPPPIADPRIADCGLQIADLKDKNTADSG